MAGFNQPLLAGNPWPIGAITHLLTEAQGNYKLPKTVHDTGALGCTVLMEPRQETVICGYISQFQPLPNLFYISLISEDGSIDREIMVCKSSTIFTPNTDIRVSSPLHPLQPLKIITLILVFQNVSCLYLRFSCWLLTRISYLAFSDHYRHNQLAKLELLILRKWRKTCQGNKWENNYCFMSLWKKKYIN